MNIIITSKTGLTADRTNQVAIAPDGLLVYWSMTEKNYVKVLPGEHIQIEIKETPNEH